MVRVTLTSDWVRFSLTNILLPSSLVQNHSLYASVQIPQLQDGALTHLLYSVSQPYCKFFNSNSITVLKKVF